MGTLEEGYSLAIIPCTGQKSDDEEAPAEEIWVGNHFQLTLAHAEMNYDKVLVLSYKYGLISPQQVIQTYDIDLRNAKARERIRWWFMLKQQIDDLCRTNPPKLVAMYTGHFERDRIIREFVKENVKQVIVPWEGLGIGLRQQAVYDNEPPFDPDKVKAGAYEVKLSIDGTSTKYLPPPTKLTDEIAWEE
jgi:hypothetical protein